MVSSLLVVYFAASSVPLAAAKMFYWSYQAENSTESYDPVFEICAEKNATSCAECNTAEDDVGARSCASDLYNNICYEPKREETCCKDKYGTSCYKDFYCAYTGENVALCCAEGESVEDCGTTFNETLSKDRSDEDEEQATSTTITNAFQPSMTATDQSRVARPDRTTPPNVVPGSTKTYSIDPEVEKQMSAAVKVGIAIGAFAGVAILVTLAVLALLHWRKRTKYNAIGHTAGDKLLAKHPEPFGAHAAPRPVSGAPGPFEPMRNEPGHDHRQSWMRSPPPQHSGPTSPNLFSDNAAYSDHPSHPQQPVELSHMPPPSHH